MGANFDYRVFKGDDRKAIEKEWAADVEQDLYDNGHSYSGGIGMLCGDIQWQSKKCSTASEAVDHIQESHQKWEPAMAVQFDGGWVIGGWCSS